MTLNQIFVMSAIILIGGQGIICSIIVLRRKIMEQRKLIITIFLSIIFMIGSSLIFFVLEPSLLVPILGTITILSCCGGPILANGLWHMTS